jgi:hypothetical protein
MKMSDHMLSTEDNPYNPFTEFDQWRVWDEQAGYYSLGLLARVVRSSPELPPEMEEQEIEDAINEIVIENVYGVHIRVARPKD